MKYKFQTSNANRRTHKSRPASDGRALVGFRLQAQQGISRLCPKSRPAELRLAGRVLELGKKILRWFSASVVDAGELNSIDKLPNFEFDREMIKSKLARNQLKIQSQGEEGRPATPLPVGLLLKISDWQHLCQSGFFAVDDRGPATPLTVRIVL